LLRAFFDRGKLSGGRAEEGKFALATVFHRFYNNLLASCQIVGSSQVVLKKNRIKGEIGGKGAVCPSLKGRGQYQEAGAREVYCPQDY